MEKCDMEQLSVEQFNVKEAIFKAKYASMLWNSPLGERHADELLEQMELSATTRIVDLGCGWGELLLRAVARTGANGIGVDTDYLAIDRGLRAAREKGVSVEFSCQSAADWRDTRDRAICIGSSHIFGGSRAMLRRLAEIVPKGRVLVGDTFWERQPTDIAREMHRDDVPMLIDLVAMCRETGWEILNLTTADQREWDNFESSHRAGLRKWIIENPDSPKAQEIREQQDERERGYIMDYRGLLGFAYLVLGR
jgi:cyclopropane fatty-acyl-phospholipid synthase-like methyltransferase